MKAGYKWMRLIRNFNAGYHRVQCSPWVMGEPVHPVNVFLSAEGDFPFDKISDYPSVARIAVRRALLDTLLMYVPAAHNPNLGAGDPELREKLSLEFASQALSSKNIYIPEEIGKKHLLDVLMPGWDEAKALANPWMIIRLDAFKANYHRVMSGFGGNGISTDLDRMAFWDSRMKVEGAFNAAHSEAAENLRIKLQFGLPINQ